MPKFIDALIKYVVNQLQDIHSTNYLVIAGGVISLIILGEGEAGYDIYLFIYLPAILCMSIFFVKSIKKNVYTGYESNNANMNVSVTVIILVCLISSSLLMSRIQSINGLGREDLINPVYGWYVWLVYWTNMLYLLIGFIYLTSQRKKNIKNAYLIFTEKAFITSVLITGASFTAYSLNKRMAEDSNANEASFEILFKNDSYNLFIYNLLTFDIFLFGILIWWLIYLKKEFNNR